MSVKLAPVNSSEERPEVQPERLNQPEAALERSNVASMMGELAASLAAAVSNAEACLQWLARDQPDLVEVREAATEMAKEARRAGKVMTGIRSLFKKQRMTYEIMDVNEVITNMVSLMREEADRSSISLQTELDPKLPRISADRVQLQQVLINLMLNGIDAMKDMAGDLFVKTESTENGRILVSVSDLGVALPVEDIDGPFEALPAKPPGTGTGLSISRKIIESHGGRLLATASPRCGATFQFTLPAS